MWQKQWCRSVNFSPRKKGGIKSCTHTDKIFFFLIALKPNSQNHRMAEIGGPLEDPGLLVPGPCSNRATCPGPCPHSFEYLTEEFVLERILKII